MKAGKIDKAGKVLSKHLEKVSVTVKKSMRHYAEYFKDRALQRTLRSATA